MGKVAFSKEHSSIEEVEDYYVDSAASLDNYFNFSAATVPFPSRFVGYSRSDLDAELKDRKDTLDRMCSLEILSAVEARFRVDYLTRCQSKKRDPLSKKLREIYKRRANKAKFEDDILATWRKMFPEHKARLDSLQRALDFRNWLAHGRYWQSKTAPHIYQYDYLGVYLLAADLISNLSLYDSQAA